MSDVKRDPAKEPADALYEPRYHDMEDWGGVRMNIGGPGGTDTHTENNEKGILESELKKVTDSTRSASLQKEGGHRWTI